MLINVVVCREKPAGRKSAVANIKSEKALFTMTPKSITTEQVNKWIKSGDLEKLEITVLMGRGKQLVGKATWNDAARTYIKGVQENIDQVCIHSSVV